MSNGANSPDGQLTPKVHTEHRGKVLVVTINRPEVRNAIDAETAAGLVAAFQAFEADNDLWVAVLAGTGGTFCAGADLKALAGNMESGASVALSEEGHAPLGVSRMQLSKPVIAAVEGYAVAGGLELALWCDLRVAAENAIFGVYCRRWGVPLVDGGTVRLPRLIGHSHALDMILTGRGVSGQEALMMGLANRLAKPGDALTSAVALAEKLTRFPQICMRSDRLSSYRQWDLPFEEAMRQETRLGVEVLQSQEAIAGARHFASGKGRHGNPMDI